MKQFDFLSDDVKAVIRCIAVTMLRNEGLLTQDDHEYVKCMRNLAEVLGVQVQIMELLIDMISGAPVDIFKVFPKDVEVNSEKGTISGKFDPTRSALLSQLFEASK